ncbi:TIGR04104 family putative zinc finger protein [Texcoconibacillus texcoconensis]|uniref:TIGR04104 family putative zinc finger protein n=1 Tax=Texcoconibacillus texcoconensis TaxID=1095777 RepID=UPI0016136155
MKSLKRTKAGGKGLLQKCEYCNMRFTWYRLFKSFWNWSNKPIICNKCGSKHILTISGRIMFVCITVFPLLIVSVYIAPFNNILLDFAIGV